MSYNITETYSQKTSSILKVWGDSRMPYYNIEDGHTGVCYKVSVVKQFTAAYQEKELMITELTDASERKFLVLHVQSGPSLDIPLFTHIGFKFFHYCPIYESCLYMNLADSETTKNYEQFKEEKRLSAYANDLVTLIQRGAGLWQETESTWNQLNGLLKNIGSDKLPSLEALLKAYSEYYILKRELEKKNR